MKLITDLWKYTVEGGIIGIVSMLACLLLMIAAAVCAARKRYQHAHVFLMVAWLTALLGLVGRLISLHSFIAASHMAQDLNSLGLIAGAYRGISFVLVPPAGLGIICLLVLAVSSPSKFFRDRTNLVLILLSMVFLVTSLLARSSVETMRLQYQVQESPNQALHGD